MILIVGLGNPGEKYQRTRHNLGFMVVDKLARELNLEWETDKKMISLRAQKFTEDTEKIVLAKPQTMMNSSGFAVTKLTKRHNLDASQLWIVHDDVDLPLGKIKIRIGGGTAGHHGVESVIEKLGTDGFVRFRLGIGHPKEKLKIKNQKLKSVEKYVLTEFNSEEKSEAKKMVKKAVEAIEIALGEGIEKAMNQFNQ